MQYEDLMTVYGAFGSNDGVSWEDEIKDDVEEARFDDNRGDQIKN